VVRSLLALCVALALQGRLPAQLPQPESIDEQATHEQVATVTLQSDDQPLQINAFCLNQKGQIVAACGNGPGKIQIANDEGTVLQSWDVSVKPEAVNVATDGTILVGGEGKLFRFSADGQELQQGDSPHAEALRKGTETLRQEAIAYLNRSVSSLGNRITSYERIIEQLETKAKRTELNEAEERMLEMLPATLERFREQAAEQEGEAAKEPSEEAIQQQVANLLRSKMKVSSVSSDKDHVYVATRGLTGYGYVVWKMQNDFSGGEVIVEDLRGCCGQMDVQCCQQGLFVAENSRHRVVRYDADGNQTTTWGQRDRTGVEGFSSCCNPMNVCFNGSNEVFTAESGTGRIKRFDADGKFLSYVGDVDLVPGCKNVSIAATPNSDRIYMLDLTRNHIVVMKTRSQQPSDKEVAAASGD